MSEVNYYKANKKSKGVSTNKVTGSDFGTANDTPKFDLENYKTKKPMPSDVPTSKQVTGSGFGTVGKPSDAKKIKSKSVDRSDEDDLKKKVEELEIKAKLLKAKNK